MVGTAGFVHCAPTAPPVWSQAVRTARHQAGLTQAALARRSGLSRNTIRRLEDAPAGWRPTHRVIARVCAALPVPAATATALRGICRPPSSAWAQRRRARGLTQSHVAATLGISQSTYQRYETGQRPIPQQLKEILSHVMAADPDRSQNRTASGARSWDSGARSLPGQSAPTHRRPCGEGES